MEEISVWKRNITEIWAINLILLSKSTYRFWKFIYISEKTLTDCRLADIMQKKINVLGINANIPSINLASELICK